MSDDKREMTDEELLKSVREQVEEEYRNAFGVDYNQQKADEELLESVREEVAKEYQEFVVDKDKDSSSGPKISRKPIDDISHDNPRVMNREEQLKILRSLKKYYEEKENGYHNGMHM